MQPLIRRAVCGDEPLLVRLNQVVHDLHVKAYPQYFKLTDADELAAHYLLLLSQPTTKIWLAEVDETPVGYVIARFRDAPEHAFCRERRWCEIDEIAVEPAWQNRGIGASLVQQVIAEARDYGASEVELTTWCFNEQAQQALEHMGFTPKCVRY